MSKIAVNEITNEAGTGGPTLPNGVAGGLTLGGDLTLDTNGIYLGGTGSANYLDDYEEGTFTMTVTDGTTTTTTSDTGTYTKVGNKVLFSLKFNNVSLSGLNGSSDMSFDGLPFSTSSNNERQVFHFLSKGYNGTETALCCQASSNSTLCIVLPIAQSGGGFVGTTIDNFSEAFDCFIHGVYFTDS